MSNAPEVLLDTDTLSLFLRNIPRVLAEADIYLRAHQGFTFSIITRFEILRGLLAKNAQRQLVKFEAICSQSKILNVTDPIIVEASEIYADLYQRGELIGDADILIAATALDNDLTIVTNNESHFARVNGLQISNWLKTN